MIQRDLYLQKIQTALSRSRVAALIGPRQSGKTTLARQFVKPDSPNYFDLEDMASITRLQEPMTAFRELRGLVVIDEIQRRPDLFPLLRVLCDREPLLARFLILGSATPDIVRASSESLAGRVETIPVSGFSLSEVGIEFQAQHWLRGGFPPSFLAESDENSLAWRKNFIQMLLERDFPQWDIRVPAPTLLRFWTMLAHYHGQIWNNAEPARSLGVSETTVRKYLDILEATFMVRTLQPWHTNISKRQIKSPKLYIRDSGLLHFLLGIRSEHDLYNHPKSGASWEGYVVEEVIKAMSPDEVYFWGTHSGAELDLLLLKNGKQIGVECKRVDAPRLTPSMRAAMSDLDLSKLLVIYPGAQPYSLAENIQVVPLANLGGNMDNLLP